MEQQEKDRSGERASFGPSPAAPRFYQQESEKLAEQRRAREEQSATARLLTPKNATGRRGVLPAAPRDPLRLAQSIVAATRQFAALPPPVGVPLAPFIFLDFLFLLYSVFRCYTFKY